jgi:large conductance mechanosensitive channel
MISVFDSIPLAIALVVGIASIAFIKSFADYIIMPIITPFIHGGYERLQLLISGQ